MKFYSVIINYKIDQQLNVAIDDKQTGSDSDSTCSVEFQSRVLRLSKK